MFLFQYYAEASEALAWLNEKTPVLSSSEVGKDEDSTQSLQRKLEAITCEIEAYEKTIDKLSVMAKSLMDRQHYDSENIASKQVNTNLILIYIKFYFP